MKEKNMELSIKELETLCKLYIECRLSVLEETELYYILLKTDKTSPLINETRIIMGAERKIINARPITNHKKPLYNRFTFYAAAVAIAVIILTVFSLNYKEQTRENTTPLLSLNTDDPFSIEYPEEKKPSIENEPDFKNRERDRPPYNGKESSNRLKISEIKSDIYNHQQEGIPELTIIDDYIEVTDEKEASIILQKIDGKMISLLEKGSDAQRSIPDIYALLDNIINKYKL